MRLLGAAAAALLLCGAANGEVKTSAANHFTVRIATTVPASPSETYQKFLQIGKSWSASHTFSSKAENLYIEAKPKGWWGEKLPNGGFVRHMQVVYAAPGKLIRFTGGLGPLQSLPINGVLTIAFAPKDKGTEIRLTYAVGGSVEGGLKTWAKPVDGVLSLQMKRLKAHIEKSAGGKAAAK